MDWVSFDEIKKTVTLQMAIEHYGISLRRVNTNTRRGRCPLPTHRSEKSTESFTATLTKGVGGAWACQSQSCKQARGRVGGNVLDFVAAMERCSVRDAAIKLQTWFLVPAAGQKPITTGENDTGTEKSSPRNQPGEKSISEKNDGVGESESKNKPLTFKLQKIDHSHPYLKERGVSEDVARKHGVGFFSGKGTMSGRIVFEIRNERGELVAYAGRSIDEQEPRYKFPNGFQKGTVLYNLDRVNEKAETIIIVEGFFGCLKLIEAGFENVVALMGSSLTEQQHELLLGFRSVILFLDGDDPGRAATKEIGGKLLHSQYVCAVPLVTGVQPDRLSISEIQNIINPLL